MSYAPHKVKSLSKSGLTAEVFKAISETEDFLQVYDIESAIERLEELKLFIEDDYEKEVAE